MDCKLLLIFLVLRRWPRALLLVLELWVGSTVIDASTTVSVGSHPLGFCLSRLPRRGQRSVYIRPVLRWCGPRTSTGSGLGSYSATPLSDFWCLVLVRGPFPGPEFLKPVGAGCCVLHVCLSWASWIPVRSSRGVNGTPFSHCASGASAGLFLSPEESGFVAIGRPVNNDRSGESRACRGKRCPVPSPHTAGTLVPVPWVSCQVGLPSALRSGTSLSDFIVGIARW